MSLAQTASLETTDPDLEGKLLELVRDLDQFSQQNYFATGLNIFETAGLIRQEIRHSNVLAFLLRPTENHGLGDSFLKGIISKALDNLSGKPPISALNLALADFSDALVFREWRNIDLLIESKANNLVVAIENKLGASEGANQLSKYESIVRAEFPSYDKSYCYLTEEGEPASNEEWSTLNYSDVIDALQNAKDRHLPALTNEARILIDHYIDVIRRNVVPDKALVEQCRKLYARHRQALDLIIRYGEVSSFISAANEFFKAHPDVKMLTSRENAATFLPASLLDIVPEINGTNWWGQARPFLFWFMLTGDNRLGLVIEVGPITNTKYNRETLARELLGYFKHAKKITSKYTRVHSDWKKLTEEGDSGEILSRMNLLYQDITSKHLVGVTAILDKFLRKSS